jgi:alpha-D-xyloside xylohydrolase
MLFLLTLLLLLLPLPAQPRRAVIQAVQRKSGVVWIRMATGLLRIEPCAQNIARITFSTGEKSPDLSNLVLLPGSCGPVAFDLRELSDRVDVSIPNLMISVSRSTGALQFSNHQENSLLSESAWPFPERITSVVKDGERTHRAAVWFALSPEERLYGLGQHQTGLLNQRNLQFELSQDNTNISIPFFLSSKGYGVLWNSAAVTDWNNRFQPVLEIHSDFTGAVDYFFIYGPQFDTIVAGYRKLTGNAPLFSRSAYGLWQSRDAYSSQAQLLGVASHYRELGIPLDNLVLDGGWETVMGSRVFNKSFPTPKAIFETLHDQHVHLMVSIWPLFQPGSANFLEMEKDGLFVSGGANSLPAYYPGARLYDAFNASARQTYWRQVRSALFDLGADAFWLDSTEPGDLYSEAHGSMLAGAKTALGNGSRNANLYPFMATLGIYSGQRAVTDRKRVFILSRSAFTGMQRNAAAAWSGDVATTFDALRRQIPAGLNFSMTGLPYWTTDIGGFLGGDTNDPAYRELFVRWFQYGAFCPIFRIHGARTNQQNEIWSYGSAAQSILTLYDHLRYRMMPYIYTLAARTTFEGYTPMRALPFDFREDTNSLDISDEFMFGPSILVAPVTVAAAQSRRVYLPAPADWYDFWNGQRFSGGGDITRETPLDVMPLYVRAGSILPMGAEVHYAGEQPEAPIELRVYPGKDADFRLYEDDGNTYDYENGELVWIPLHWDDNARVLSFLARQGSFPEMQRRQKFRIVLVTPGHGVGEAPAVEGEDLVYDGSPKQVHCPPGAC